MLKSSALTVCALLAFAWASPAAATADEAGDLFERCTRHLRRLEQRCVNANASTARECIPLIERLLNDGQEEEARKVAARCIERIENTTAACRTAVQRLCHECISKLNRLGAERLAARMREQCDNAIESINQSARRAIQAIRGLFDD